MTDPAMIEAGMTGGSRLGIRPLAVPILAVLATAPAAVMSIAPTAVWAESMDAPDPSLCRALTAHRPAPDVEYVPGIDVRGNPVAPADLPGSVGSGAVTLDRFEIPVTLDFARGMGFGGGRAGAALPGNAEIGRLTIDGSRVLFNGQPIGDTSRRRLDAACRGYR